MQHGAVLKCHHHQKSHILLQQPVRNVSFPFPESATGPWSADGAFIAGGALAGSAVGKAGEFPGGSAVWGGPTGWKCSGEEEGGSTAIAARKRKNPRKSVQWLSQFSDDVGSSLRLVQKLRIRLQRISSAGWNKRARQLIQLFFTVLAYLLSVIAATANNMQCWLVVQNAHHHKTLPCSSSSKQGKCVVTPCSVKKQARHFFLFEEKKLISAINWFICNPQTYSIATWRPFHTEHFAPRVVRSWFIVFATRKTT